MSHSQTMSQKKKLISIKKNELAPSNIVLNSQSKALKAKNHGKKKRDLSRFVKWPKFMRIQRQKQVLSKKLKIPSIINQFIRVPPKNMTRYINETFFNKADSWRLKFGYDYPNFQSISKYIRHGIKNVVNYIRKRIALFVIIAYDVNPIEMIVWLPFLCKKYNVPFMIVQNKRLLGQALGVKGTSCAVVRTHITKPLLSDKLKKFFFEGIQKIETEIQQNAS